MELASPLDANTKEYTLNPTILYQKLARREGVITLFDMPDLAMLRQRDHIPVSYVFPASGTPLLVDAIAIVKGTHHPIRARVLRVRDKPATAAGRGP